MGILDGLFSNPRKREAALLGAAANGDANEIKMLLSKKTNPNCQDTDGNTPLHHAARNGHLDACKLILDAGGNVHAINTPDSAPNNGWTSLMVAAANDDVEIARFLLERGADANFKMQTGLTTLVQAVINENVEMIDILLGAGANINEVIPVNGLGAFGIAVDNKYMGLAKHLLDKGAKPDFGNVETLPLAVAEWGDIELIQAIENRGGSIIRDDIRGKIAFVAARNKDGEVLDYLLNHGADINDRNDFAYTPLILASLTNHPELVQRYLERGDDANAKDADHETALSLAIEKDHTEVVALLRQHGAEERGYPGLSDEKSMLRAAEDGALGTILNLRDMGVSLDTEDAKGNAPIMLAAAAGHLGVVRTLCHLGAGIDHHNHEGISAADLAQSFGQTAVLNTLGEFGAEDAYGILTGDDGIKVISEDDPRSVISAEDMLFGRSSHPYKEHTQNKSTTNEKIEGSEMNEEGHELNEVLNEKLSQVEELLGRKNIVEKFPRELREAMHEKIETIRHGGLTLNLIKEFEELGALVKIITSAHEEKEGDDDMHQIFSAAVEGDIKVLRNIIKSGANIHSVLPDGTTLLMVATEHGQESIVDELIRSRVDVNQVRQDSFSAMLLACFAGYEGIAQSLLNAGADVNARYIICSSQGAVGDYTTLMIAAIRGNLPLCKILLKHGADIDAMNDAGNTPLMCSLTNGGNADVAQFLLKAGANPDPDVVSTVSFATAYTPLILAVMNEQTEIVKELISRRVRLDEPDGNGWTALKHATKNGDKKLIKMLTNAGAAVDLAVVDDDNLENLKEDDPVPVIFKSIVSGDIKFFENFINSGHDINFSLPTGINLLMTAAASGQESMVAELIDRGADVNQLDSEGHSALWYAFNILQERIIRLLIEAGADIHWVSHDGLTALHYAAVLGSTDIVNILLKAGASVDSEDNEGSTPLMYATAQGHLAVGELLIQAGANPDNLNNIDE